MEKMIDTFDFGKVTLRECFESDTSLNGEDYVEVIDEDNNIIGEIYNYNIDEINDEVIRDCFVNY